MKRFTLFVLALCLLLLIAPATAEESAATLVSCEYAVYGGMENEDFACVLRLDDSPETAMLTLAEGGGFEAFAVPREALDDLAEMMAACDPAGWSSLPEREEFALDAPERRIALIYDDGSEYTLYDDRVGGGPIFAETEKYFLGLLGR